MWAKDRPHRGQLFVFLLTSAPQFSQKNRAPMIELGVGRRGAACNGIPRGSS
jgi:hypothetical protein